MARSAAIGRDAFVDPKTSVASYYWQAMNRGAGPYPHHAWWQVGWITDYLLSEIAFRTENKITFPKGFVTPKVGPHQTYGFQEGSIFDNPANLVVKEGFIAGNQPTVDPILAENPTTKDAYIMLLNNRVQPSDGQISIHADKWMPGKKVKSISKLNHVKTSKSLEKATTINYQIPGFGIAVYHVVFE